MKKVMEPKLIKEENVEKDNSSTYIETPRIKGKVSSKERCKTPDSPESVRPAASAMGGPVSPTQSSPPCHPTNGTTSPLNNGSADSLTPPLPPSTALSVSLEANNQQQQFNHGSYSSSITRPLVKVKRFLSTLVQFGNDIGAEVGERVRSLVLNLVSSNLSIEEFHHSLQDVTNFPLRPFVLPFLRTHLPILQREIHALARANKQSSLQYVRSHDHVILDSTHSPSELSEIFISNEPPLTGTKRRISDSTYENGVNGHQYDSQDCLSVKRPATAQQNPFLFTHQSLLLPNLAPSSHLFDYNQHGHFGQRSEEGASGAAAASNKGDEEWRNIHVMLNCILSMVEKTKRALAILQQRNSVQEAGGDWLRKQEVGVDLKKAANEIVAQAVRQTEDRVAEVRRRAEDAVNDVKRQAVVELQKAVAAAEAKANEMVAAERAKIEKALAEARKQQQHVNGEEGGVEAADNSLSPSTTQHNSCWNCGRKAHETCSGCSVARYCGPFCQHKDWENHHQICAKDKTRPLRVSTPSTTAATPSHGPAQNDTVKFKK